MIVKSEKLLWKYILFMFVIFLLVSIICFIDNVPILFSLMMWGLTFYLLICITISLGKTIIMDEKDCTLCFLKYQRTYKWEEFKVKHMDDRRNIYHSPTDQAPYSSFVLFSVKELHKPKNMLPDTYNCYFCPFSFSFFYVYFKVDDMHSSKPLPYPEIYTVDEKEFLEKMQQWGVELEVYNACEERFK